MHWFITGPFSLSLEEEISIHSSSTNSVHENPVNYESIDSRLITNSPAARRAPFNRSPYSRSPYNSISVELGGPDEHTKLLDS